MTENERGKSDKTAQENADAGDKAASAPPLLKVRVELPTGRIYEIELARHLSVEDFYDDLSQRFSMRGWELVVLSSTGQFTIVYGEEDRSAGATEVAALTGPADFDHFILTYPIVCA